MQENRAISLEWGKRDTERRPRRRPTRDNDKVKYVTRYERFILGDFPMVCARSGLPAMPRARTTDQLTAATIAEPEAGRVA